MSVVFMIAIGVYLLATACCVLLFRRMQSWQMRLLTVVIGILPLCQTALLLKERGIWSAPVTHELTDLVELLISALFLVTVFLLEIDSTERARTEMRLRMAESAEPKVGPLSTPRTVLAGVGPWKPRKRKRFRRRMEISGHRGPGELKAGDRLP